MITLITILYIIAVSFCVYMIVVTNPVYSVLFLIGSFSTVAMIFLLIRCEFYALIFYIVYVGAIAVIFLFVVMMLNVKKIEKDNSTYLIIGSIIVFIFFISILLVTYNSAFAYGLEIHNTNYSFMEVSSMDEGSRINLIKDTGTLLYILRPILVISAGAILLIALIASIYLTNTKRGFSKKKQFNQLSRKSKIRNVKIYN